VEIAVDECGFLRWWRRFKHEGTKGTKRGAGSGMARGRKLTQTEGRRGNCEAEKLREMGEFECAGAIEVEGGFPSLARRASVSASLTLRVTICGR